jgi:lysophospholipase L1-like esterase
VPATATALHAFDFDFDFDTKDPSMTPTAPILDQPASGRESPDVRRRALVFGAPLAAAGLAWSTPGLAASRQDFYALGTWAGSLVSAAPSDANRLNNQTARQVVNVSVGGESVRVKLSNRYGTAPLVISAASIALRNGNEQVFASSVRPLRFSGKSSFTIPAFAELYSDWVLLSVPSLSELSVDLYVAADTSAGTSPLTLHNVRPAPQLGSYLADGNQVGTTSFPTTATRTQIYFMTGVDVSNPRVPGTVCCFGDSITHGTNSTVNANARYPDFLARRLVFGNQIPTLSLVNSGIAGNRVLMGGTGENALARFDRDALVQSGVSNIIVLEGINDISGGNVAARLIEGHRQMILRSHARGIRILGGTVTPFANAPQAREDERQALNAWIRSSGEYDGVVDFDAAVRDPANPRAMLPMFDSGDTLHPNSAGYAAMANAVDLSLLNTAKLRR